MRYDLFVKERCNISRVSGIYKKSFIGILLKHHYISHINSLLLIPDLFVRPTMACLWCHHWCHDLSNQHFQLFIYLIITCFLKKTLYVNWVQCNVFFLNKVWIHFECKFGVYICWCCENCFLFISFLLFLLVLVWASDLRKNLKKKKKYCWGSVICNWIRWWRMQ